MSGGVGVHSQGRPHGSGRGAWPCSIDAPPRRTGIPEIPQAGKGQRVQICRVLDSNFILVSGTTE